MVDKRFYQPAEDQGWVVVIYEVQSRFTMNNAQEMIAGMIAACKDVGKLIRRSCPVAPPTTP